MKNIDKKFLDIIAKSYSDNKSKNDIAEELMIAGIKFGDIQKAFKESGVTFRKSSEDNWKMRTARLFSENPNATFDDMTTAIGDSVSDPEYYSKGWFESYSLLAQNLAK